MAYRHLCQLCQRCMAIETGTCQRGRLAADARVAVVFGRRRVRWCQLQWLVTRRADSSVEGRTALLSPRVVCASGHEDTAGRERVGGTVGEGGSSSGQVCSCWLVGVVQDSKGAPLHSFELVHCGLQSVDVTADC